MAIEATASQGRPDLDLPAAGMSTSTTAEQVKKKKTLADDVATARSNVQRRGHIGPLQNWRLSAFFMEALSFDDKIHLGLVSSRYDRKKSRQMKLTHLHSLTRRGADGLDAAEFTRCALRRFRSREMEIRLQHNPEVMKQHEGSNEYDYDMMEELLLDTAFILEQLIQHWEAGNLPNLVMGTKQYRFDFVQLSNQTPYILLQELVKMVKLPPMAADKPECFLKSIAIGYIVAEKAAEWLLTKYNGPVYHLLHLVYLHLCSAVDVSPEPSPAPPWRSLLARCRATGRRVFSEAARSAKQALRPAQHAAEHELFATAWWSYSMIPPARDLCRVGIRLRTKKGTRCLAAVCFRDGVLELPPLDFIGFDCRLLVNLVALELEWESIRPLFLSYAVFMSELMTTRRDMELLQSAGVLTVDKIMVEPEFIFFKLIADLNSGRELHGHFVQLAKKMKISYEHLSSHATACGKSSCLSA